MPNMPMPPQVTNPLIKGKDSGYCARRTARRLARAARHNKTTAHLFDLLSDVTSCEIFLGPRLWPEAMTLYLNKAAQHNYDQILATLIRRHPQRVASGNLPDRAIPTSVKSYVRCSACDFKLRRTSWNKHIGTQKHRLNSLN